MIVNRRTFNLKPDRVEDALALAKATQPAFGHNSRYYVPLVAAWHVLVWEAEFQSLAEYDGAMAEYWTRPEAAEELKKWRECFAGGGANELWELVE